MLNQATAPLRLEAAKAAFGSGVAEVAARVLGMGLTIITARVLEPRDVGFLGLAVIVIGVISMIGFYPETAAVAARGDSDHNSHALAALIVRSALIAALLGVLAAGFHLVAHYLTGGAEGETALRQLVAVLFWLPILECIAGYPRVVLQRRLDLYFLAWMNAIQAVVFVGLATILLLRGGGYMSVAWANLSGAAAIFLILSSRMIARGWFSFEGWPARELWREILLGSSRVFLGGFGGYLGARLDNLLVAGAMGPAVMSYYSIAWNASRVPTGILSRAINFVCVPTFARIQDDRERIERGIRECLSYSYLVLTPVCAGLFVCAPELVTTILGAKWIPAVPALRLMCFTVLVGPLLDTSNALVVGTGRAHLAGIAAIVRIAGLLLLIQPLVLRWNVIGAAWGDLLSSVASTIALLVVAHAVERNIKWPVASTLAPPVAAAFCAGAAAWVAGAYVDPGYARLAFQISILCALYSCIVASIGGKKLLRDIAGLIRGILVGRQAAAEPRGRVSVNYESAR